MRALALVACLLLPTAAAAQHVEIAAFGGYRFGGDYLEYLTDAAQDADGGPAFGAVCDVPLGGGLALEILYSRQTAHAVLRTPAGSTERLSGTNEYWHAGGRQDFGAHAVRPFLTGTLGLTRLAMAGDNEVRFSLGAGGGVILRESGRVALRLDGRVIVTFTDASGSAAACGSSTCFTALHVSTLWQADFTAGVAFRL